MKAYLVAPSNDLYDCGCALFFANTVSKAKAIGLGYFWDECYYVDMRAWRKPAFDKYSDTEGVIETNSDLPRVVEFYTDI